MDAKSGEFDTEEPTLTYAEAAIEAGVRDSNIFDGEEPTQPFILLDDDYLVDPCTELTHEQELDDTPL